MKKFPYLPMAMFIGAAILGMINAPLGPVDLSGLAFVWFGFGMILLFNHFKNDLLMTAENVLTRYLEAMAKGRKRADAEILSRSEEEVAHRIDEIGRRQ